MTDSQKKAKAKYSRENVKQIVYKFYPKDIDLFNWLKKIGQSEVKNILRNFFEKSIDK